MSSRLSAAFGVPVAIGSASVGLSGSIELVDVQVGSILRAERVQAALGSRAWSEGFAPEEIVLERPVVRIAVDRHGRSNLDALLARRSQIGPPAVAGLGPREPRLARVRLHDADIRIELADLGYVQVRDLEILPMGSRTRVVTGPVAFALKWRGHELQGGLRRFAMEVGSSDWQLERLIADGGVVRMTTAAARHEASELLIFMDGEDRLTVKAHTRDASTRGRVTATATRVPGGLAFDLAVEDTSIGWIGPWLPSWWREPGRASGQLHMELGATLRAAGHVTVAGASLAHPALAQTMVEIDTEMKFDARRSAAPHLWDIDIERATIGKMSWRGRITGHLAADDRPRTSRLSLALDEISCASALGSVPLALRHRLAGLDLDGTMGGAVDLLVDPSAEDPIALRVDLGASSGCHALFDPPDADVRTLRGSLQHHTVDGTILDLDRASRTFVALKDLPAHVSAAFVAAEDGRFFHHHGFDLHQIERSLAVDVREGALVRGGSTISQQLVKNLFLSRDKSLSRKLQEAILTWRLESVIDKDRILELYLNVIELGDMGTYGLRAAATRWFGQNPEELTVAQAAFLAAMTPEPRTMSARLRAYGGIDPISAERAQVILRAMRRDGVISDGAYRRALRERLMLSSSALAIKPR